MSGAVFSDENALAEIREQFGDEVARLVDGVTEEKRDAERRLEELDSLAGRRQELRERRAELDDDSDADESPEDLTPPDQRFLDGEALSVHLKHALVAAEDGRFYEHGGIDWVAVRDAYEEAGVDLCYEIHPGEDLHDGVTYEMFLQHVDNHARANLLYDPSHFVLQQLDYLEHLDLYAEFIKMFHVKDAELNPTGRQGVYGGQRLGLIGGGKA